MNICLLQAEAWYDYFSTDVLGKGMNPLLPVFYLIDNWGEKVLFIVQKECGWTTRQILSLLIFLSI